MCARSSRKKETDGTIASVTYPSGWTVAYDVGGAERAISATDSADSLNYVAMASYAPPGELGGMMYGQATGFGGISNAAAYNSRLELTSATASSSAGSAQSLGFNYNLPAGNNGTVSSIQNSVTSGLSQSFTYDSLDRILSGATTATSGTGCWGQSFGPSGNPPAGPPEDFWGNLSQINDTQCATGTLSVVINTTTNRIATSGFSYDASGDMTADGSGYTYTFDAENHLTQASGTPSGTWTYVYDGNGLRVEKTNGTSGTLYWRDLMGNTIAETDLTGSTTDSAYREYIFFAGGRVAQRDATTPTPNVYFYYTDQIGSIGTITKANGTPCYQATFTPYGQEMATQTACASNYKFTGYERDAETGLDYAFARYYNQRLGRFMSADPLGGDITDTQSLNRYAYVTNSPTSLFDPNGTHVCAFQDTMTFSSGSFGCTGGGGATNSNLWDSMAFGFIETYDVFQGYYVNDTSDAALWQDVAMGGGEMNYLFSFSVSEGIDGFGGYALGWDGGGYTPQKPTSKPCPPSGNAPSPSSYQAEAQTAQLLNNGVNASGSFINAVNLLSFHRGGSLDAQAYGASTAYGNYAFGVYTSAYGYSLSFTLSAANAYGALFSTYKWSRTLQPDSTYTHIPAANVSNITQGYNDQRNGSLCNPH